MARRFPPSEGTCRSSILAHTGSGRQGVFQGALTSSHPRRSNRRRANAREKSEGASTAPPPPAIPGRRISLRHAVTAGAESATEMCRCGRPAAATPTDRTRTVTDLPSPLAVLVRRAGDACSLNAMLNDAESAGQRAEWPRLRDICALCDHSSRLRRHESTRRSARQPSNAIVGGPKASHIRLPMVGFCASG